MLNQEKISPSSFAFDSIRKVVELTRRLAIEDYFRHVEAINQTEKEDFRNEAISHLVESHKVASEMDNAFKSLMSAETDFRGLTVSLYHGYTQKAEKQARESSDHLKDVVRNLCSFSETAYRSKFFSVALDEISRTDKSEGKMESEFDILIEVSQFSFGVKNFAKSASDFAKSILFMPSSAKRKMHEDGFKLFDFIKSTGFEFINEFKSYSETKSDSGVNHDDKINHDNYFGLIGKKSAWLIIKNYSNELVSEEEKKYEIIKNNEKILTFLQALGKIPINTTNQEKIYTEIESFYNKKDSSPRQSLYTHLISEFIGETDPQKRNNYVQTMSIMADQIEQSTIEKQNAKSSLDYMKLRFPYTGKETNSNKSCAMNIEIAMKILDILSDSSSKELFNKNEFKFNRINSLNYNYFFCEKKQ